MSNDEDDDNKGNDRKRDKNRGDKNRGGENKGNTRKQIDLSENKGFLERMLVNEVETMGGHIGEALGRQLPFLAQGGDWLRSQVGPQIAGLITRLATDSAAAVAQVPGPLKKWIKDHGGDRLVNANLDRGLDAIVRAVGESITRKQVGKDEDGNATFANMLDVEDANRRLAKVREDFAKAAANLKSHTFEEAILRLEDAGRTDIDTILKEFTVDDMKRFDMYRMKLADPEALKLFILRASAQTDAASRSNERIKYLERTYGIVRPPASAGGAIAAIGGAIKRADAAIKAAVGPPATGPDPVVQAMNNGTARLNRRRGQ
ncbi:MAG: hypothetical protein WA001_05675 [Patescibacteria group bacterium]